MGEALFLVHLLLLLVLEVVQQLWGRRRRPLGGRCLRERLRVWRGALGFLRRFRGGTAYKAGVLEGVSFPVRLCRCLSRGVGGCGRLCLARRRLVWGLRDHSGSRGHGHEGLGVLEAIWAASVPW